MKALLSFLAVLTFFGFLQQPNASELEQPPHLYLHFFILGEPPHRILTTTIRLGDDMDIRVGSDTETLSGRIENRDGKFFAHLRGHYGTSTGDFDGEVELEKPFSPTTYGFSGAIFLTHFVLSTNSDCKLFLVNEVEAPKSK
jgi:hypothetical protein